MISVPKLNLGKTPNQEKFEAADFEMKRETHVEAGGIVEAMKTLEDLEPWEWEERWWTEEEEKKAIRSIAKAILNKFHNGDNQEEIEEEEEEKKRN